MADTEIRFKISIDGSGLKAGIDAAKREIAGLAPLLQQLNGSFQTMGAEIKASIADAMRSAADSAKKGESAFDRFKKGLDNIKDIGGTVVAVATAVAEFSQKLGKAAQETTQFARNLHTTTGDIQAMQALASATGTSMDVFSGAMQGLDQTFAAAKTGGKQQNDALKAIGLSADGSYTKMDMLSAAMAKFSGMEEGPAKTALAMQLFGQAGTDLLPVLNSSSEQMANFNTTLDDYGIRNDAAVAKGNALAESWNVNSIAMQGVNTVLTDALAPVLTQITDSVNQLIKAFIESYTQGGAVAVIFRAITGVVEIVGVAIDGLAGIFSDLWHAVSEITYDIASAVTGLFGVTLPDKFTIANTAINIVKNTFIVLKNIVIIVIELIKTIIDQLIADVQKSTTAIYNFFTLKWDRIGSDWHNGTAALAVKVEDTARRIKAAMAEARDAMAATLHGETLSKPAANNNLPKGAGAGGKGQPADTSPPPKPRATGGKTGVPSAPAAPGTATDTDEVALCQRITDQKTAIVTEGEKTKTKVTNDAETERAKLQNKTITAMASLWAQNISKLVTLQQGFGASLRNIYNGMVGMASDALMQILKKWITAELGKTGAVLTGTAIRTGAEEGAAAKSIIISAATAIKQIAHAAGVAAARVWAAVSEMGPFGWVIAPALAAGALYGVIKLGQSVFSAEGGMGAVPYDNAPFLLHRNEMVLPASLASPLRAMLQGGGAANGNAPFAANDGGRSADFHYHDHSGTMTPAQIMANRSAFAKAMKQAYREGAFAGSKITV